MYILDSLHRQAPTYSFTSTLNICVSLIWRVLSTPLSTDYIALLRANHHSSFLCRPNLQSLLAGYTQEMSKLDRKSRPRCSLKKPSRPL